MRTTAMSRLMPGMLFPGMGSAEIFPPFPSLFIEQIQDCKAEDCNVGIKVSALKNAWKTELFKRIAIDSRLKIALTFQP